MAFTQDKIAKSFNQKRGIFDAFIYRTSDSLIEVLSSNYFKDVRFLRNDESDWKNGVITVIGDSYYSILIISSDGLSVTAIAGEANAFTGGLFDYNDLATATVPITVLAGIPKILTNDGLGTETNKAYPPNAVTDVWNAITNQFDWSQLKLGDMVDIRLDFDLITSSNNTEITVNLALGTGAGSYVIPFISGMDFKDQATHNITRYNGLYMGNTNTLDNGGEFQIIADKDCTVTVNGWYCKIIKRAS